jgi:hypothetical protein
MDLITGYIAEKATEGAVSSILKNPVALIILIIVVLIFSYISLGDRKTPEELEAEGMAKLELLYGALERGTLQYSALNQLPENQRLLINTQVFASRYAGYLGPLIGGVFPKDPVPLAALTYKTGFRLIVIELDMEPDHVTPKLVAIDGRGVYGEIGGAEKKRDYLKNYITGLIDAHKSRSGDPLILYFHFHDVPPIGTEPRNFLALTGAVAEALAPADPYLLRDSPTGTYTRQGQEHKIFFTPVKDLGTRPVIVLTNIDTTPYRKLKELALPAVSAAADFDLKVHVRVYGEGDTLKDKPAAFAAQASYWLDTPEKMVADAQARCKETFSIVFPVGVGEMSKAQVNTLYNTYGVHAIAFPMFDVEADVLVGTKSPHRSSAWIVKPPMLRYVPPEPIQINDASSKTNSGGGRIVAPKL